MLLGLAGVGAGLAAERFAPQISKPLAAAGAGFLTGGPMGAVVAAGSQMVVSGQGLNLGGLLGGGQASNGGWN